MSDLISVIVPIFGVESYLRRCVDSLLRQTYRNIEILLIDDGSLDSCGMICDEYALKDDRIKAFHKLNGGLSDARNYGIDRANGEYICFVDPDDYVADDYCLSMHDAAIYENADIVICSYTKFYGESLPVVSEKQGSYEVIDTHEALKRLYLPDGIMYPVAWNKLYKRSIISDLRYPVGVINEDEFTTYKFILNSKRIVVLDKILYYYYQNSTGITSSQSNLSNFDLFDALIERRQYFIELGLDEDLIKLTNKAYLNRIIFRNRELKKADRDKYKELHSIFRRFYRRNKDKVNGRGYLIYYYAPDFYDFLVKVFNL